MSDIRIVGVLLKVVNRIEQRVAGPPAAGASSSKAFPHEPPPQTKDVRCRVQTSIRVDGGSHSG